MNAKTGELYEVDEGGRALLLNLSTGENLPKGDIFDFMLNEGLLVDPSEKKDRGKFLVQLHLLNACNLKCRHCYDWKNPVTSLTFEQNLGVLDNFVAFLKNNFPQVEIVINKENYGFAGGYNEALKQVAAEYYCLLNSDIEVTPGWIEPIIDFMEAHPKVGACQPKVLSFQEKDTFEHAGASGGFIDKLGYPFCRGRIFMELEKDKGQYDSPTQIFWATGACLFVRSNLYHELEGLDFDFFAHMEEIDFCWRLGHAGHQLYCIPASSVYHVGGGTLPKHNPRKTYLNFRNNLFLLYKNLPSNRLYRVLTIRFFLDILAMIKFLTDGYSKDAKAVFNAYISFYCSLRTLRKKRKALQPGYFKQVLNTSIVYQHYIRRISKYQDLPDKWL